MVVATQEITQQYTRLRFTVEQYHAMADAGVFGPDERIELIQGEFVKMAAIGTRHVYCVTDTDRLVQTAAADVAIVLVQNPIQLGNDSEPQPDIAVMWRSVDRSALPTASDVLLVIEVSDSSLAFDRNVKLPLYARAGIPEARIFDLTNNRIERHTDPSPHGYRSITSAVRGDVPTSLSLSSLTFEVDAVIATSEKPEKQDE